MSAIKNGIRLTLSIELTNEHKQHPDLAASAIGQELRKRADEIESDKELAKRLLKSADPIVGKVE